MTAVFQNALDDLRAGCRKHRVWRALAAQTIDESHRRTLLGPVWLLVNYLLYAGTFVVLFGPLIDAENYPAYVAVGLLVWLFIQESMSQGVSLFTREAAFISGTVLPLSVYVLRQVWQSTIRSAYALIGAVAIVLFSGVHPTAEWLWSAPAVGLILATAPAVVILFAVAGVVFPDMQFIIGHLVRLGLFLSPIFWVPATSGRLQDILYRWNPITYFLEIVRMPIYAGVFPVTAWQFAASISVALWIAALFVLGRYRKQIVFML